MTTTPPNPPTLAHVLEVAREVHAAAGSVAAALPDHRDNCGPWGCTHRRDGAIQAAYAAFERIVEHEPEKFDRLAVWALAIGPALEEWRAARKALVAAKAGVAAGYVNDEDPDALGGALGVQVGASERMRAASKALTAALDSLDSLAACDRADADATARAAAGGKGT